MHFMDFSIQKVLRICPEAASFVRVYLLNSVPSGCTGVPSTTPLNRFLAFCKVQQASLAQPGSKIRLSFARLRLGRRAERGVNSPAVGLRFISSKWPPVARNPLVPCARCSEFCRAC